MTWEAVIGLEIHVQLRDADEDVLPVPEPLRRRAEHQRLPGLPRAPGMLPVANREAVDQALRVGLALGCRIPAHSKWDRKNYFYPDSPKAYQISQYDEPLCAEGTFLEASVGITRAHLEEDAAKTIHVGGGGGRIAGSDASIVDFNRAGTPLLEIVTDPDIRDAAQARRFLTMLRATVIATGASDCDLEKGSLRVDANVSVRRARRDRVRHEVRAQEHELVPLPGARHQRRDPAADRAARGRRARRAGDDALRPRQRRAVAAALEGGGGRLPLLPRARPVPVEPDPAHLDELRAALTELPLARIARLAGRVRAVRRDGRVARPRRRPDGVLRGRRGPHGRRQGERQLGAWASSPRS